MEHLFDMSEWSISINDLNQHTAVTGVQRKEREHLFNLTLAQINDMICVFLFGFRRHNSFSFISRRHASNMLILITETPLTCTDGQLGRHTDLPQVLTHLETTAARDNALQVGQYNHLSTDTPLLLYKIKDEFA